MTLANFVHDNVWKILLGILLIAVFYFSFYFTTASLKKLKIEAFQNYPFGLFFPQGGAWSIGYFLLVILILGLLVFFEVKGGFILGPA